MVKAVSDVWGEDLRASPRKGEVIRGMKMLCRRAGIEIKDRPSGGWGTKAHPLGGWRWWGVDELNDLVDYVEVQAEKVVGR